MTLEIGDSVPQFSLLATSGSKMSLDQLRGEKATAIIFWCNHCPYVIPNQQRVRQLQSEFKDKGVHFAAICSNNAESHPADSFENMVIRAAEMEYNFPYLHDEDQSVARSFGAERTPHVFLFDAALNLAYRGRIDDNPQDERNVASPDLRNAIEALLSGKKPDPTETGPMGCSIKWKN